MRIITSLMSCLMALAGCDEKPSVTHITRVSGDAGAMFSKATQVEGVATFQCFESDSGRCHYLIYTERCPGVAAGEHSANCERETLEHFALAAGERREVHGLPENFRLCVDRQTISTAAGCGS